MSYTTISRVSGALQDIDITPNTAPSTDDVDRWIDEVKSSIDSLFGKTFTSTTVTDEYVDYDGSGFLRLPYAPIVSISSMEYLGGSLGGSVSTTSLSEGRSNDFIVYKDSGEVQFFSSRKPNRGFQCIKWSGVVGFSETPEWVRELATLMVVRKFISATVNSVSQKGGRAISVGNLSLGAPSNFSSSRLKAIDDEIEGLVSSRVNAAHVHRNTRIFRM